MCMPGLAEGSTRLADHLYIRSSRLSCLDNMSGLAEGSTWLADHLYIRSSRLSCLDNMSGLAEGSTWLADHLYIRSSKLSCLDRMPGLAEGSTWLADHLYIRSSKLSCCLIPVRYLIQRNRPNKEVWAKIGCYARIWERGLVMCATVWKLTHPVTSSVDDDDDNVS